MRIRVCVWCVLGINFTFTLIGKMRVARSINSIRLVGCRANGRGVESRGGGDAENSKKRMLRANSHIERTNDRNCSLSNVWIFLMNARYENECQSATENRREKKTCFKTSFHHNQKECLRSSNFYSLFCGWWPQPGLCVTRFFVFASSLSTTSARFVSVCA